VTWWWPNWGQNM